MKDRVTFPADFWELGKFFFQAPVEFDGQVMAKRWNEEVVNVLKAFQQKLEKLPRIMANIAKATLESTSAELGIDTGKILPSLRMSLTGGASGPDLMMTMEILGKEEVIRRIDYALKTLTAKARP